MSKKSVRKKARRTRDWVEDQVSHGQHVIYFHVPKCGGRSVRAGLRRAFSVGRIGVAELDPRASARAADALGELALDVRERWLLYQVAVGRAHLIAGHFAYSPHIRELSDRPWTMLTVLREPTAHLLSQFFYNRDKGDDLSHAQIESGTQLKDFLRSDRARGIGTSFVGHFTDPALRAASHTDEAIEAAVRNLATVDAVGTLEHLDDWVDQVAALTGQRLKVGQSNTSPTPQSVRLAEVDDEAREMVNDVCRVNRIVYERVLGERAVPVPV